MAHCARYNAARHAKELAAMEMAGGCPFVLRLYGGTAPGRAPYGVYMVGDQAAVWGGAAGRRREAGRRARHGTWRLAAV